MTTVMRDRITMTRERSGQVLPPPKDMRPALLAAPKSPEPPSAPPA